MSQQQQDAQGEAHDALGTAVSSYGRRVLGDPHMLGNLVTDLLPDLPRERSLLVTGAEAGIAAQMTQHVEEQHIDPDTAVQLAARSLSERRSIEPAASMWVASEYAQALGYQVRPSVPPPRPGEPDVTPAEMPTITAPSGPPMATAPPPAALPPQGPAPPARPPSGGPPPTANRSKRGPVIAAIAVAGAVVLYLIIAAVAQTFPFAKSSQAPVASPSASAPATPTPTPTPATTPTPTAAPSAPLARGVTPLTQLLPIGIADPATQCSAAGKPEWGSPGLVTALMCHDTNLPKGYVTGYQMDNRADFDTAWRNFNSWEGFDSSSAQSSCPPSGSSAHGITTWNSENFPTMAGQVLECWADSDAAPIYVWTLPTQNTFFVAMGADGSSFKTLDDWWTNYSEPASPPTTTPKPQAS